MNQKRFCGIGCTVVGTIGGVILAPFLGPLAIALPPLLGTFGYKMAEAQGLPGGSAFNTNGRVSLLDNFSNDNQDKPVRSKASRRTQPMQPNGMFRIFDEHTALRERISDALSPDQRVQPVAVQPVTGQSVVRRRRNAPGLKGARGSIENEAYFRRRR